MILLWSFDSKAGPKWFKNKHTEKKYIGKNLIFTVQKRIDIYILEYILRNHKERACNFTTMSRKEYSLTWIVSSRSDLKRMCVDTERNSNNQEMKWSISRYRDIECQCRKWCIYRCDAIGSSFPVDEITLFERMRFMKSWFQWVILSTRIRWSKIK